MSDGEAVPQVPGVPAVSAADVPGDAFLLDVREQDEWEAGHAPGALHIPLGELNVRYTEIARDQPLYVICRSGTRSAYAASALAGAGWQASNVSDGMIGWQAAGRPMTCASGTPYVA
jgi:rhodanese-related sulfurtransferase